MNIIHINNFSRFELQMSNLRNYYHGNILAFGDLLHKIHPLAGQGFNMTLRDIKIFSEIIHERLNLGLPLDISANILTSEEEYLTRLTNGENVYIACFVGCTYHCG